MFIGGYADEPHHRRPIPVFIADYVLMGYGTGAIMAVPGQDERDWEFAELFGLPIVRTVEPPEGWEGEAYVGEGPAINSANADVDLNGLGIADAKRRIIDWLEATGAGEGTVTTQLRDWLFSRQRYWGEPFPIVYDPDDGLPRALPETMLPVVLPDVDDYSPTTFADDDETSVPVPPLARATEWVEVTLDLGEGPKAYRRETNTMPQWAGSCWYELRYLDPTNDKAFVDPENERYWMGPRFDGDCGGVDLYVGGAEHAVLHLLYARFWHKVLFDLGHVSSFEPYRRLFNQGMIQAAAYTDDRGIYVDAAEVDRARRRLLARRPAGPPRVREDGQEPAQRGHARRHVRHLRRRHAAAVRDVHRSARPEPAVGHQGGRRRVPAAAAHLAQRDRRGHRRGDASRDDTARRRHPAGPAPHHRRGARAAWSAAVQRVDRPHHRAEQPPDRALPATAACRDGGRAAGAAAGAAGPARREELWSRLGHADSLADEPFPEADPALLVDETVEIPVQVNGKVRTRIRVPGRRRRGRRRGRGPGRRAGGGAARGGHRAAVIVVPGRLVNFVVG